MAILSKYLGFVSWEWEVGKWGKWGSGKWEVGKWGSGEIELKPQNPKTPKPQPPTPKTCLGVWESPISSLADFFVQK
ncbi:hypothetical protein OA58_18235 [Microcystis aeruginosa NIES-88]|nr:MULTISPECIES: hypothetical protein [Microcystis]KXS90030.1 hypothetical protein OA58_18235 [Microcystis aeruginosa NIES-88]TRT63855.1 MAG: hypothetical protein EWV68_21140 [Microcystis sp. M_QC_C_20170808_M9Col]TRT69157.1 MAG: hypothetical protein EWV67_00795 [Microcystis sp. M_QC_C_20170808_M2Col]